MNEQFRKFAQKVSSICGSPYAFSFSALVIIIWALMGPLFKYSDTWQLVINTGTTIITFLMVFLIQKAQNKDSLAIQLKLNELVASHELASNRLVDIEDMTEQEMETIKKYYVHLNKLARKEETLQCSHSIEEAEELHHRKKLKKAPFQDKPTTP